MNIIFKIVLVVRFSSWFEKRRKWESFWCLLLVVKTNLFDETLV